MLVSSIYYVRVFITGAANGIGKATTERLVREGHKVIAYDKDREGLETLPDEVQTYQGNVTNEERLKEVVRKEIFEVIVNCAGIQKQGSVEDMSSEDFHDQIRVNYLGTVKATKAALPMIKEREGRIINISSIAGKVTAPFLGGYSASKHALEGFSDALRMELKSTEVDVVLVEPGPIQTGFNERARDYLENFLPGSEYSESYEEKLETDYGGASPEKPAKTIQKAISTSRPASRYVTPLKYRALIKVIGVLPRGLKDRILSNR